MMVGMAMTVALYILGLMVLCMFFVWRHSKSGKKSGRKYLLWTPLIVLLPTGVKVRYNAVQMKRIVVRFARRIANRCFLMRLLSSLSVKKTNRSRMSSMYKKFALLKVAWLVI